MRAGRAVARRLCDAGTYPRALLAAASYGLAGATQEFPTEPLDDPSWARLLAAACEHRVTGPLGTSVAAGALPATPSQAQQAAAAHRGFTLRALALEARLVSVVDLLAGAGIDSRVLKGAAVARLDYRQPAARSFIDLDILVRACDFDAAVSTFTAAGFQRTLAEPRPGFDRRFDKGTTLRHTTGRYDIDLHRTFVLGPWGRLVDLDALWDGGEEFTIGDRRLRALSRLNRFIHACYHAALGDWPLRLGSLRDIAEMLPGIEPDATALMLRASSWGVEAVVAAAVADTRRLLGITTTGTLPSWADHYLPSRRDAAWLGLHTHPDKTFAAQALATLRVLPGWRDKAAYARALAMPDTRYVAGRHASPLSRFRYAAREIRRGRPVS